MSYYFLSCAKVTVVCGKGKMNAKKGEQKYCAIIGGSERILYIDLLHYIGSYFQTTVTLPTLISGFLGFVSDELL